MKLLARCAVLVLAVGASTSCLRTHRMYFGEPLPPEEVVIVEPWGKTTPFTKTRTGILAVDGQEVPANHKVEMLPGRHSVLPGLSLTRGYETMTTRTWRAMLFDGLAGHTYRIKAHFEVPFFLLGTLEGHKDEIDIWVWIEDKASGEVVSGDAAP